MTNSKQIGLDAELCIREYCESQNFQILAQNFKIRGIECDLLVVTPINEIWILEVKTLGNSHYFERRVSHSQKTRIRIVLNSLLLKYPSNVIRAHLVTVTKNHKIQWHYDFFVI